MKVHPLVRAIKWDRACLTLARNSRWWIFVLRHGIRHKKKYTTTWSGRFYVGRRGSPASPRQKVRHALLSYTLLRHTLYIRRPCEPHLNVKKQKNKGVDSRLYASVRDAIYNRVSSSAHTPVCPNRNTPRRRRNNTS